MSTTATTAPLETITTDDAENQYRRVWAAIPCAYRPGARSDDFEPPHVIAKRAKVSTATARAILTDLWQLNACARSALTAASTRYGRTPDDRYPFGGTR